MKRIVSFAVIALGLGSFSNGFRMIADGTASQAQQAPGLAFPGAKAVAIETSRPNAGFQDILTALPALAVFRSY